MEYLNKIELRGVVGNVKCQTVNDKTMVRFSLATSEAYKNQEGTAVINTTWFNVVAFESKFINCLDKIEKGTKLFISGKVRIQKFLGTDGLEKTSVDVMASKISLIDPAESLQYEMD